MRVRSLIDWVGIKSYENAEEISVGEGQLLTFARTMAMDASVVILDEATLP